jgi:hypothetical protein
MSYNVQSYSELNIEKKGLFSRILGRKNVKTESVLPQIANLNIIEAQDILDCVKSSKNQLEVASMNFEYADSEEMVDYYTFVIKACQIRYGYYLKKAKEFGLTVETLDLPTYC